MADPTSSNGNDWFWSQRGATLGPVDFTEIRRLVGNGSIARDTWVFDPAQGAWVTADSIAGLFVSTPPAAGPASAFAASPAAPPTTPPDAAPAAVFCRFCGAQNDPTASRCASCGREQGATASSDGIDPKVAEVICRASILAAPILFSLTLIGSLIGPAIVWALGSRNARVVAEAKQTFNCQLTLLVVLVGVWIVGVIGFILIIPAVLAGVATLGLAVYCVVVGIVGLIAAADGRPYSYPWVIRFIK